MVGRKILAGAPNISAPLTRRSGGSPTLGDKFAKPMGADAERPVHEIVAILQRVHQGDFDDLRLGKMRLQGVDVNRRGGLTPIGIVNR